MADRGILIRADASPQMGTGHIMRCLALAQAACEKGILVQLIGRVTVPWVLEKLACVSISFTAVSGDVPATEDPEDLLARLGGNKGKGWVVLDGYHFGWDCHEAVRAAGYRLLIIDDYAHLHEYSCDVLLNQNIGAEGFVYKGSIGQKLLGPAYIILRPEFFTARKYVAERSFPERAKNILLTLGGSDFSEYLARIAPDFSATRLESCILRVIAGAVPQEQIRELLRNCPAELEIFDRVDEMSELLLDTDLCVTAGGSTCWELCCLGVPFLALETAENQRNIIYELKERGIAPYYDPESFAAMLWDSAARRNCAEAGTALVDGLGAGRVMRVLIGQ